MCVDRYCWDLIVIYTLVSNLIHRTEMSQCLSDSEFLAKLHCLRMALEVSIKCCFMLFVLKCSSNLIWRCHECFILPLRPIPFNCLPYPWTLKNQLWSRWYVDTKFVMFNAEFVKFYAKVRSITLLPVLFIFNLRCTSVNICIESKQYIIIIVSEGRNCH